MASRALVAVVIVKIWSLLSNQQHWELLSVFAVATAGRENKIPKCHRVNLSNTWASPHFCQTIHRWAVPSLYWWPVTNTRQRNLKSIFQHLSNNLESIHVQTSKRLDVLWERILEICVMLCIYLLCTYTHLIGHKNKYLSSSIVTSAYVQRNTCCSVFLLLFVCCWFASPLVPYSTLRSYAFPFFFFFNDLTRMIIHATFVCIMNAAIRHAKALLSLHLTLVSRTNEFKKNKKWNNVTYAWFWSKKGKKKSVCLRPQPKAQNIGFSQKIIM